MLTYVRKRRGSSLSDRENERPRDSWQILVINSVASVSTFRFYEVT
jgi:hypothetical protein